MGHEYGNSNAEHGRAYNPPLLGYGGESGELQRPARVSVPCFCGVTGGTLMFGKGI